jgi:hypothetical protein
MTIGLLTLQDAEAYRILRLEALTPERVVRKHFQ